MSNQLNNNHMDMQQNFKDENMQSLDSQISDLNTQPNRADNGFKGI
jgi:hypothetical protein